MRRVPRLKIHKILPALALWANDRPPLPLWRSETRPEVCKLKISQKVNHLARLHMNREMARLGIKDNDFNRVGKYRAENHDKTLAMVSAPYRAHKEECVEIANLILSMGVGAVRCDIIDKNIHLAMMIWELLDAPDMEVAGAYLFLSAKSYQIWRADDHDPKRKTCEANTSSTHPA